jgi:Zn-dependent M16 (insulinase) family peptidase
VHWKSLPLLALLAASCLPGQPAQPPPPPVAPAAAVTSLEGLAPGASVQGFVASAVYVGDEDRLRGARFVHARTGFALDYLQIESAPQAFIHVTTYPTSDQGEPHTQEHLLLGKGNKGRFLGNAEHVALASSSAFTAHTRTAYHFHTTAGVDSFWGLLRTELDTLLHPDYSDEEIRREVRDFGVTAGAGGGLVLGEKGTVYNEMVQSSEEPSRSGWWATSRLLYGPGHPLGWVSGGTPEGIRALTPADIRRFHAAHYQLGNMGMIAAFPASVPLATVLARAGETLDALASVGPGPGAPPQRFLTERDLPPPHGAEAGALRVVEYPHGSAGHPGPAMLAWPATRALDVGERLVLEVFLGAFASGQGSTLYKALVDRKTRVLDVGATSVWSHVGNDQGQPAYVGLESVNADHADEASLRRVREVVLAELRAVAALPDGSPELAAFGERVRARIVEAQRYLDKFLDTPPGFGDRGIGDTWLSHLEDVNRGAGFRRSLTQADLFTRALAVATSTQNPWRERIQAWGLLEAPYGVVMRASPALRARLDQGRADRVRAETARLVAAYGARDADEALRRRKDEIDRESEEIARATASVPMPPFVPDPPMTPDDLLAFRAETRRGIPVVASTFETMKSAAVGLALRLDAVPEEALPLLAILPALIEEVGVIRDGVAIPYDEVQDRLRREVLHLDVRFDVSFSEGRAELVLEASGNDVGETRRALGWMRDMLASPDWRPENLARLRDVVKARATALHDATSDREEHWPERAAWAYWRQERPLLAHAGSALTRVHDAHRLSWMLEAGADAKGVAPFLEKLAAAKGDRASLGRLAVTLGALGEAAHGEPLPPAHTAYVVAARALVPTARARVVKAGRDLGQLLGDVPDASLAADWAYLCRQMARDVERPLADTLDALGRTLRAVRHASQARAWIVGSSQHQEAVRGDVDQLLASLDPAPLPRLTYAQRPRVLDRARARGASAADATFVALVNPSAANAALVNATSTAKLDETREEALVDHLAVDVFGGTGGHSFYKRIWGAGIAYSGYVNSSARSGRMTLYSDRCASLPELLRFVEGEVRRAPADPRFVDYAVARAFDSRVADSYEARARAMAADLADGATPERHRAFRSRLLALRGRPGLAEAIHARLGAVFAPIIPSLPAPGPPPPDTVLFVTGPEAHLAAYERELRAARGEATSVVRLFPRDFWDTGEPEPRSAHAASKHSAGVTTM